MTLFDVQRLFAHWRRFPPLRRLVAGFVGFKPDMDGDPEKKHLTAEEAMALFRTTGGMIAGMGRK